MNKIKRFFMQLMGWRFIDHKLGNGTLTVSWNKSAEKKMKERHGIDMEEQINDMIDQSHHTFTYDK